MTTPAAPGATPDWKKMKVQELRDELTSRGLDTSGLKVTLIERLETAAVKGEEEEDIPEIAAEDGGRKDMELDINEGAPAIDEIIEKDAVASESIVTEPLVVAEDMAAEVLPVTSDAPPVDPVAEGEVDAAAPAQSAAASVTNGAAVVPSSDLEKKQRRAERFGLELMVSEGEKRKLRAARFGEAAGTKTNGAAAKEDEAKMSPTTKDAEAVKRKARAARFGIDEVGDKPAVAASPTGNDDSKKKARLARFGLEVKLDPQEQEKKKLRAARFALPTEAKPDTEPEKKVEVAVEEPVVAT